MLLVNPKHGERLAVQIRTPQSARLDDGPNLIGFGFQFGLKFFRDALLGDLSKAFARIATVFPHPKRARMRRSYHFAEMCQAVLLRKLFWVSVFAPQAFEYHLELLCG